MYCLIARVYHYTFAQIADMTPANQRILLGERSMQAPTVFFATDADYQKWLAER